MKKKKTGLSFLFLLPILVTGCSTTNYKIVNDNIPEENRKNILIKDTGSCKQQAYSVIQYNPPIITNNETTPQKYVLRNKYNQPIGSVTTEKQNQHTSIYDSFKKAQENSRIRSGSYENRINEYTISCLRAKGWRKEYIEGKQ